MNDLTFYLAGLIFFLILSISEKKQKPKKFLKLDPKEILVQIKNPKTKIYVQIDKSNPKAKAQRIAFLKRHLKKGLILLPRKRKEDCLLK